MREKDGGDKNKNPLVSICTTFFNAEKYINRLLESCLNQTYKNIEVVIVDDASTDDSEKMVQKYMARDSRISYYKNDENVGLAESELKMFRLARGEFSMMIGADDWLARNYIENGVRTFLNHPDTAGVVPKLVSLIEEKDGAFCFFNNALYEFIPPKTYSTEWFVKNAYRPKGLFASALALVRTKDWILAMNYYIENFYCNPPKSTPGDLRRLFKMAWAIDVVMFLEILTRHKDFVFDSSLSYIKITLSSGQANNLDFKMSSLAEIIKESYYQLFVHAHVYKFLWPKFYQGMKIFRGAQMLSTALMYSFKNAFSPSFLNLRESMRYFSAFFSGLSFFEIAAAAIYSMGMFVARSFGDAKRKLVKQSNYIAEESSIFNRENFLNDEKHFIAT